MATERLQKIISQAGILSRRKAEELITLGLVTVNGKIAKLGDKAELGTDAIKVNGKLLQSKEPPIYLAFNKPKNVISMLGDPQGRPSLAEYLTKIHSKIYPVGRLDFGSEGLILLTNDGEFAEKLQKSEKLLRVYQVKVKGHPDRAMLAKIEKGGRVDDKMIQFHSVALLEEFTSKARIQIVVEGSGAADIKAFFELKRFSVDRIVRTAIGHITLRGLKPGSFRYLTPSQAQALITQPELGERSVEEGRVSSSDREKLLAAKREGVDLQKPKIVIRTQDGERGGVSIEKFRNPGQDWGRPMGRGGSAAGRDARPPKRDFVGADRGERPKRSFGAGRDERPKRDFGAGRDERPKRSFGAGRDDRPKRSFGADREDGPKPTFSAAPRAERPKRDFGAGREERPKRSFGAGQGERPKRSFGAGRDERPKREFRNPRDEQPKRSFGGAGQGERPKRKFSDGIERGAGYRPRSSAGPKPAGGGSDRGGFKPKRPPRR